MDLILNYDEIVSKFNLDLVNKLRKHGSEVNYLNLWVPDEDFFRSFKSLSESIKAAGVKSFTLDVDKKYLKSNEFKKLQLAYPNLIIERNKESNLLYFKNLESFNIEKKIVDQVVDKNQCIVQYIYGSTTKSLKNEHLKGFFVDFYKNNLSFFKSFFMNKPYKKMDIKINEINFVLFYENKKFKGFKIDSSDKSLIGCIFMFNKLFYDKEISFLIENALSEFITFIKNKTKNHIKGISLPFNLGKEVFLLNELCQFTFKKFETKGTPNKLDGQWYLKKDKEREKICKKALNDFLNYQKKRNTLIFNKLENDINGEPLRYFVSALEDVEIRNKSSLIRKLEKYLKLKVEKKLQVYYEEKKDLSKIRRL